MIINNILELTKNDSSSNEYLIDNQKYVVKILFVNADLSVFTMSKNSIKSFNINDNAFDPFNYSSISFVDNDNAFQRLKTNNEDSEFNPELSNILKGFQYRGDGRDFLFVEFIPIDNANEVYGTENEDFNNKFGYRKLFVCTDDSESLQGDETIKTINLIDFDEKILREQKSFFSSADLIENQKNIFLLSNSERQVKTGICIKNLLKNSLFLKSFNQVQKLKKDNTPDFEEGLSEIFYTSPADNTAYDDLLYLLSKHVSDDPNNDFSILKKGNFDNKYSLKSVSALFKKAYNVEDGTAGEENLEKLFITGTSDSDPVIQSDKKTPDRIASFGQYSEIKDVNFFNTDSIINSEKLKTKVLHSYNFSDKTFNIDKKNSDILNVKNKFNNNYVNNMKGKDNNPFPNLIVNQMKGTNLSFDNAYSLYGENDNIRLSEGVNNLLKSSIVTNLAAEITLKGQLFRKAGKFISIERDGEYVDNLFDDKFLGIYFILNIEHNFIDDTKYINKILAVKTYIHKDPKFNEEVI